MPLVARAGPADVTVRVRQRPGWADDATDSARILRAAEPDDPDPNIIEAAWTIGGQGIRIRYAEGATFWIASEADTIWMEWQAPLTGADAAHFLLEPVLAFVLRLRGVLVLHASAVVFDGQAVVICGGAGAGKSSVAGSCAAAGAEYLSDDVVALGRAPTGWLGHPGTPAIRLWDDGARALVGDAGRVPRFSETWEKRVVAPEVLGSRRARGATPLALVVALGPRIATGDPALEALAGHAAFAALVPHTSANYLHDAGRRAVELGQLADLINAVPVARLSAPEDAAALPRVASLLRGRLRD